ncbi:tRNA (guanine(26)-N(2)/guanine(27)-N(2))-dimethyltransferase [Candidatus Calditenuaceae archaeon HR02]|nr:tRNA (guanine(26)-N(2)/guanine(27)-N(2))-dimethyltransferase [Candidatus Calditenuaceae archaeon HR02]
MEAAPLPPFPVKMVREGVAELVVPETGETQATTKLPAFYNPLSKVSRDLAVIVVGAYFSGGTCSLAAEPLAGTGARIIRLLLESGSVSEGLAGDISEWAVRLCEINRRRNGLTERLRIEHLDANLLLSRLAVEGRACYVDIDPFGSPARFLENGFRATERRGLLGVSATDLAALSGSSRRTAYWKYGLTLVKTNFYRETAIRALAGFAVMTASRLSLGAEPILSVAYRHFVRVFLRVERGKRRAHHARALVRYLIHCQYCLNVSVISNVTEWREKCSICGNPNTIIGPIWTGALHDKNLVERILSSGHASDPTYGEAIKIIKAISEELDDIPWSFQLSEVSRRARTSPPKTKHVVEKLREVGYRASSTHYDPAAVKTDAPPDVLTKIVKELVHN